jgi:hypothetical protein
MTHAPSVPTTRATVPMRAIAGSPA